MTKPNVMAWNGRLLIQYDPHAVRDLLEKSGRIRFKNGNGVRGFIGRAKLACTTFSPNGCSVYPLDGSVQDNWEKIVPVRGRLYVTQQPRPDKKTMAKIKKRQDELRADSCVLMVGTWTSGDQEPRFEVTW